MEITFLLLPLSLILGLIAFLAFAWSVLSGQYDDVDSSALRPLTDEEGPVSAERNEQHGETPRSS